ncbi:MAG TPA: hypothetical protein DCS29_02165 [Candidatus Magasanikbacteria bacterium]|nr:MAG: hypothetical protein A2479_00485 [Candidatus Magasanikbacteria bacterium RIFOXYC2_FULL_39_8]HAT03561.1 hypothetical protein [Candidatus Magasanikbacteria bacterium]
MGIDSLSPLEEARKKAQALLAENVRIFFDDFGESEDAIEAFAMSIEGFDKSQLQEYRQALALTLSNFSRDSRAGNPLVIFYEKCLEKVDAQMENVE